MLTSCFSNITKQFNTDRSNMAVSKSKDDNKVVLAGRFEVLKILGSGAFGKVYQAYDKEEKEDVAVKVEGPHIPYPALKSEKYFYDILRDWGGVPRIKFYGKDRGERILVMDLLGPSIGYYFNNLKRQLSLKSVLMLADQMLCIMQYIHRKSIVHCDIKPDNFVMGVGYKSHRVYLVDFGLAAFYRNPITKKHIPFGTAKSPTGTVRFASIRTSFGAVCSRRDDMESLGYTLIYLAKGSLPWEIIEGAVKKFKFESVGKKKEALPISELCKGLPKEFQMYMHHIRDLDFEQAPDYRFFRHTFGRLFFALHYDYDYQFDWINMERRAEVQIATITEDVTLQVLQCQKKKPEEITNAVPSARVESRAKGKLKDDQSIVAESFAKILKIQRDKLKKLGDRTGTSVKPYNSPRRAKVRTTLREQFDDQEGAMGITLPKYMDDISDENDDFWLT